MLISDYIMNAPLTEVDSLTTALNENTDTKNKNMKSN